MNRITVPILLALAALPPAVAIAEADEAAQPRSEGVELTSHEPSLLGWTYDQSGHGYMDFQLSVKFAVFPAWVDRWTSQHGRVYFAFTGRSGQYFDRKSSPVIGKRFNPELFYRHGLQDQRYLDVGYGHESNGQQINTPEAYRQAQATLERPEYADDYISRGWDYVRIALRSRSYPGFWTGDTVHATYSFRRFLDDGLFQGPPEEYNSWENNPEGKPREQVDGIRVLLQYTHRAANPGEVLLSGWKFSLTYTTGYREIFRYNSVRLEAGVKFLQLPVIVWTARGYNSDLARYYKDINASGVAIEIGSF